MVLLQYDGILRLNGIQRNLEVIYLIGTCVMVTYRESLYRPINLRYSTSSFILRILRFGCEARIRKS